MRYQVESRHYLFGESDTFEGATIILNFARARYADDHGIIHIRMRLG